MRTDGDEIWVLDLERGSSTRLTFDPAEDETPAWSPDGRWVAYAATRGGQRVILRKRADGSGAEETLWSFTGHAHVDAFTPDGRALLVSRDPNEPQTDIWILPIGKPEAARALIQGPMRQQLARVSPDGRWIAYASNESRRDEVYVQPFPTLDGRWQVSTGGGSEPLWARQGGRLYYRNNESVFAVDVRAGTTFEAGVPQRLFDNIFVRKANSNAHTGWDVGPDGRFLMERPDEQARGPINLVQNFGAEIARRLAN